MSDELIPAERAAALRDEFDLSFAVPPSPETRGAENLLAIVVGGHPYALRLSEVGALVADRPVVPVPTGDSRFLGIIGYRSLVIPVFDLAAMLGYATAGTPRWIALAGTTDRPIGLAFERFDAQVQIRDGIAAGTDGAPGRTAPHVAGAVSHDGVVRSILSIDSLIGALGARATGPEGALK